MKKAYKIGILIVVVVLIGFGVMIWRNSKQPNVSVDCSVNVTSVAYVTQRAFVPTCIKVPSGASITYFNQSDEELAVAPDPHPIHTGNKEVSAGEFTLNVAPHESKQVTLTNKGTFGVHDHNNSSARLVIVVQ